MLRLILDYAHGPVAALHKHVFERVQGRPERLLRQTAQGIKQTALLVPLAIKAVCDQRVRATGIVRPNEKARAYECGLCDQSPGLSEVVKEA